MPDGVPAKVVNKSEQPQDRIGDTNTIYDVSAWTVFWRNMVAGLGRSIGGTLIYVVFLIVAALIFREVVLPQLKPLMDSYQQALKTLNRTQQLQDTVEKLPSFDQGQRDNNNIDQDSQQSLDVDQILANPEAQKILQQFQGDQNAGE